VGVAAVVPPQAANSVASNPAQANSAPRLIEREPSSIRFMSCLLTGIQANQRC
jgi:hypothetical protein